MSAVTCPACGGSGEAWMDEGDDEGYYDRCAHCEGTGKLTEARLAELDERQPGLGRISRTYYGTSAGDIAKALGVHRQTFYVWERRDDFPAALGTVGNARVWDLDEVARWREQADLAPGRPRGSS